VPAVRHQLVALQQAAIDAGSFVVEGRDIASVVWPQAELKIYLTADPEVRAQRRAAQASAPDNTPAELNQIAADLHRRDTFDSSRTTSPLTQTTDAVEVDTSSMSIEGVVAHLAALAWQAIGVRAHD
jgi:cytidylate kinase